MPSSATLSSDDSRRVGSAAPAAIDADAERLARAVQRDHALVWRTLRRFGVPERDVADAAQRVFMALAERCARVALDKETAFLVSVAVRVAANARRKLERTREVLTDDLDSAADTCSGVPTPEGLLREKQRLAELDRWLLTLPVEQRTVFVLFELEGFSLPEIARMLEVPLGTATSRLRRARAHFEGCFGERADNQGGEP